jgi:aminoglycoside 3-N-acetyltransferase
MISYRDITLGLEKLGLNRSTPVLAHIAASRMREVRGGIDTLLGALLATIDNIMVPSFTYSTMVIPQNGPEGNHIQYGSGQQSNLNASIFRHDLPSDMKDNEVAEALRGYPGIYRSNHPIFSFTGLGLDIALINHPADEPYAPIQKLIELQGWVALIGADAADNFSIHYAEFLAGRKQFTRWALTADGIVECPHFPGCPDGFQKVNYYLQEELRSAVVGDSEWHAIPLEVLVNSAAALIRDDPFALLCNSLSCPRCNLVRKTVKSQITDKWQTEE